MPIVGIEDVVTTNRKQYTERAMESRPVLFPDVRDVGDVAMAEALADRRCTSHPLDGYTTMDT